jgi:hypothetical protein
MTSLFLEVVFLVRRFHSNFDFFRIQVDRKCLSAIERTEEIERISSDDARCRQLRQIPSFGPLISTATSLTARPSWQTGVTEFLPGAIDLVPDISLDASPNNPGYLYCSSDSTSTGITGSCSNGPRLAIL